MHQIMALSQDESVFLTDTPPRNWFFDIRVWDFGAYGWSRCLSQAHVGTARAALEADEALAQLRHVVVPARYARTSTTVMS